MSVFGIRVRDRMTGEEGVTIQSHGCVPGYLMVEFPRGNYACLVFTLEDLGQVQAVVDPEKCRKCKFEMGGVCHRYDDRRNDCHAFRPGKTYDPCKPYPDCQQEI